MARAPQDDDGRPPTLADLAGGAVPDKVARRIEAREPQRRRRSRRPRSRIWGWLIGLSLLMLLAGGAAAGALAWFLLDTGRSPREWAPYLERRAKGNHGIIVVAAGWVAGYLREADLLERRAEPELPPGIGAAAIRSGPPAPAGARLVTNIAQLAAAVAAAVPGEVITLVPGSYAIGGRGLFLGRAGTAVAPITIRAEKLGDAVITSSVPEAFKIAAPHWVIENLVVRGTCPAHSDCEHAVHVVGNAQNTVIRNNRFEDFNAQIKINGEGGVFPDSGRIEGNTLVNAAPRDTRTPITPIDLVGSSAWRIAGNFIADFQRKGGGSATYGAFMKGEGSATVMERNLVLCEWKLRRSPGSNSAGPNIGLSIGGGGTYPDAVKRELGKTGYEQSGGVIRDNVIAFCNDVGIYVNKGHRSTVAHNTVLDTAGIGVRFAESSADVVANLVDGAVQARDGALVRASDNAGGGLLGLFLGHHPVRELFRDVAKLDLRWRERPEPVTSGDLRRDLCGAERTGRVMPGAFEDFAQCRRP